jgi:predicted acetyltransferase
VWTCALKHLTPSTGTPGPRPAQSGRPAPTRTGRASGWRAISPPPGEVHTTFLWIMSGSEFLGSIDLRHYLNDFLADAGGHIGYSVRPTARGSGVATWALRTTLPLAVGLGLSRVLLTCDPDNEASRRTIENSGGIYEGRRATSIGPKLRSWIDLSPDSLAEP